MIVVSNIAKSAMKRQILGFKARSQGKTEYLFYVSDERLRKINFIQKYWKLTVLPNHFQKRQFPSFQEYSTWQGRTVRENYSKWSYIFMTTHILWKFCNYYRFCEHPSHPAQRNVDNSKFDTPFLFAWILQDFPTSLGKIARFKADSRFARILDYRD